MALLKSLFRDLIARSISDYSYPQTREAGCWFHSGNLFVDL